MRCVLVKVILQGPVITSVDRTLLVMMLICLPREYSRMDVKGPGDHSTVTTSLAGPPPSVVLDVDVVVRGRYQQTYDGGHGQDVG